jgi:putative hydrolase of the HAD superfamily
MLPWKEINTVLLDMDGTLLDLHFDNHFWMEYVPKKWAAKQGISLERSHQLMKVEYERVAGQLEWYCLDYWSGRLDLDIRRLKREIQHLISLRPDTLPFLDALHQSGREVVLVTNAHPDSLSLKVERTQLDKHIDTLISTHEFGVSKESQLLWQRLHQRVGFNSEKTLFVDDSLIILEASATYGIAHQLAVLNPDSQQPDRVVEQWLATADYRELIDEILMNPVTNHSGS